MLHFSQFEWLTFDCYGTLIDWETGILGALRPILAAHHRNLGDEGLLELYGAIEQQIESADYQTYRNVLRQCVTTIGARLGFTATPQEMDALPDSLKNWLPFSDSVAALAQLKRRYKLAALTNCDDDLFAHSAKLLGNPFDAAVTAQQARSYKPGMNHFRLFQERTGYGLSCPRKCPLGVEVKYDLREYPETLKLLEDSMVIGSHSYPLFPQPLELMQAYVKAFQRVFANLEQALA